MDFESVLEDGQLEKRFVVRYTCERKLVYFLLALHITMPRVTHRKCTFDAKYSQLGYSSQLQANPHTTTETIL
jgi:hypothetical protein